MPTASELASKLTALRQEHGAFLAGFKTESGGYDMSAEQVGEFNKRNDELGVLQSEYETLLRVEKAAAENAAALAPQGRIVQGEVKDAKPARIKTRDHLDAAFKSALDANAQTLKAMSEGARGTVRFDIDVDTKTLVTLADAAPPADRQPPTGSAIWYGDIEGLFASGTTDVNSISGYIQTTDTDNAAFVAEGSAATDSAFSWTLTTDEVETIQSWIPVTREFLADNAGMQTIVTGMLADRLQKEVNQQLLSGTGTTPQLWGIAVRSGVQTQAKGNDPAMDAIHKAMTLVRVTGDANPTAIVMHSTDWQNLRLTRTSDGIYILGNPSEAGPMQLWGLPVRLSNHVVAAGSAGTALVADFTYSQIFNRQGLTVEASTEHSTYFTERKVALAVSRRMSVFNFRPSAAAKVTGL